MMDKIQKLRDEMMFHAMAAQKIAEVAQKENRELTAEEAENIENFLTQSRNAKNQIEKIKHNQDILDKVDGHLADVSAADRVRVPQPSGKQGGEPRSDDRNESKYPNVSAPAARYSKLKAFKDERAALASAQALRATLFQNYSAQKWCTDNGVNYHNLMSTGDNTKGGVLVPTPMLQAIIDLREVYGVFRRECAAVPGGLVPMGSDIITISRRAGGLTAVATGEGSSITESDKTFNQITLTAQKWSILTRVSSELNEDAMISIVDDLANEMAYTFALKEDECGFNGEGTSAFHGVTGVVTKLEGTSGLEGHVAAPGGQATFATVTTATLSSVVGTLPEYAEMFGPRWYVSKAGYANMLARLQFTAGGSDLSDVSGPAQRSFMGYPVVVSQVLNTSTGSLNGKVMALFGVLGMAAKFGDRRGVNVAVSNDRYFDTDEIGVRATTRFAINVHDIGDTTDAGPIVALVGTT